MARVGAKKVAAAIATHLREVGFITSKTPDEVALGPGKERAWRVNVSRPGELSRAQGWGALADSTEVFVYDKTLEVVIEGHIAADVDRAIKAIR